MRQSQRGRKRQFVGVGTLSAQGGVMIPDPAGNLIVLSYADLAALIGASGGLTLPVYTADPATPGNDTAILFRDTSVTPNNFELHVWDGSGVKNVFPIGSYLP